MATKEIKAPTTEILPPVVNPKAAKLFYRLVEAQTVAELKSVLSGTGFVDVQSEEVQAAIKRVTGG